MSGENWFHHTRRVGWTEVDPSSNYQFTAVLRYVEEAEIALLRDRGVLSRLYPHLPRTFVRAEFRSPARFDDEVTVAIRPSRVGRSSVEFAFEVRQDARLCAEGTLGAALIGDDGRATPLPDDVRAALTGAVVEAGHAAG